MKPSGAQQVKQPENKEFSRLVADLMADEDKHLQDIKNLLNYNVKLGLIAQVKCSSVPAIVAFLVYKGVLKNPLPANTQQIVVPNVNVLEPPKNSPFVQPTPPPKPPVAVVPVVEDTNEEGQNLDELPSVECENNEMEIFSTNSEVVNTEIPVEVKPAPKVENKVVKKVTWFCAHCKRQSQNNSCDVCDQKSQAPPQRPPQKKNNEIVTKAPLPVDLTNRIFNPLVIPPRRTYDPNLFVDLQPNFEEENTVIHPVEFRQIVNMLELDSVITQRMSLSSSAIYGGSVSQSSPHPVGHAGQKRKFPGYQGAFGTEFGSLYEPVEKKRKLEL